MQSFFTVSGVARHLGVAPRHISDLFYARKLSDSTCPVVEGRRVIPVSYLETIEGVLRQEGLLSHEEASHA